MRGWLALGWLLMAGAGCGPGVDPAFAGRWQGTSVITNASNVSDTMRLIGGFVVVVAGDGAIVSGGCPDGSGSITAHGVGRTVGWSGSAPCPSFGSPSCSSIAWTYQSGTADLTSDTTIRVRSALSLAGCGIIIDGSLIFTGTR